MKKKYAIWRILIVSLLVLSQIWESTFVFAQKEEKLPRDYLVGIGDVILVSVPERPDLSKELKVNKNGDVSIPLVGNVRVAGLTTDEIRVKVFQALKEYYPSISAVSIKVQEAAGQVIYVLGQVGKPGKYTFPVSPNLWEAIREAGGPTQNASLDNVRVVNDKSRGGKSRVVNVMEALELASVEKLPMLKNGDTVVIPEKTDVYTGSFGVNVFGAVLHPGIYRLQARQDLMSAILLAGGPTRTASLERIRIIRPQSDGSVRTIEVNMKKFLKEGDPMSNPKLHPGDTIHIPSQNRVAFLFKNDLGFILNIVTAGVTIAALVVSVQRNRR